MNPDALPYPGLRPFDEDDQELFFGRETQVLGLIRQLRNHAFVAVVGSSGSGKSSLVRAGLLPAVREGFLLGTTNWRIVTMKPGHQPYLRLLRALETGLKPAARPPESPIQDRTALEHQAATTTPSANSSTALDAPLTDEERPAFAKLLGSDRGLLKLLEEADIAPDTRVLIVVDQFEEIFGFRRAAADRDKVASRDEAAAFVRMLICSCSERDSHVRVVLTMRSDFIGDCEAFLDLPEAISRSQFLVPRLDRSQMAEAIQRPAEIKDAPFAPFQVEESLVTRIINDAGDRPDQLPLMQHALMQTWKLSDKTQLTHRNYETAGGIEKALSKHTDAAWDEIKHDPHQALITQRLFLLLCDVSPDGQITRRRPRVQEVMDVTDATLDEIKSIVQIFQKDDRNFLLPPDGKSLVPEAMLDISHEALLRRWELFSEWQEQERSDAAELRRLVDLAQIHGRQQGDTLSTRDLARIADWRKRISERWSHRYVPREHWRAAVTFIDESERVSRRQSRIRFLRWAFFGGGLPLMIAVMILLSVLVVYGLQTITALTVAQAGMETALVNGFTRSIGVSASEAPSSDEINATWELAELKDSDNVRKRTIEKWFAREDTVTKPLRNDGTGLRAATGLNKALQQVSAARISHWADTIASQMEATPRSDVDRLSKLGIVLAELTNQVDPMDAPSLARRGLLAMVPAIAASSADQQPPDKFVPFEGKIKGEDPDSQSKMDGSVSQQLFDQPEFCEALFQLSRRATNVELQDVESQNVVQAAFLLADEIAKESDSNKVILLKKALLALAAHIEQVDVARLADRLATAVENSQEDDDYRVHTLLSALEALADRLESTEAAPLAHRLATALENWQTAGGYRLVALLSALAALANRLEPQDAAPLAKRLVEVVTKSQDADSYRVYRVSKELAALVVRLEPEDAARLTTPEVERLVGLLENPQETVEHRLGNLESAIVALAGGVKPTDAKRLADRLEKVVRNPEETDDLRRVSVSKTLAALAARLESTEAARLITPGAERLVALLENTNETDPYRLLSLSYALSALADRLEPTVRAGLAKQAADRLVTRLLQETDVDALADSLVELSAHLKPEDARRLGDHLVMATKTETDLSRLQVLFNMLTIPTAGLESASAAQLAAPLAERLAERLVAASEQDPEFILSTDAYSNSLILGYLEPEVATRIATRLATAIKEETNADQQMKLRSMLNAVAVRLEPEAVQTRLLAISQLIADPSLPDPPSKDEEEAPDRKRFRALLQPLDKQKLTEVLKWPFCVGEKETLVLEELERDLSEEFHRSIMFDGDLNKFIEQAPSLGIKDFDAPAQRPGIYSVISELKALTQAP